RKIFINARSLFPGRNWSADGRDRITAGCAIWPLLFRGSDHGASVSNQRAFAGRPAAGLTALGPASAGSECRSRGCPQSPPARTSRRLAGCNSRTWPPSADLRQCRTKASRRLGRHAWSIAAAAAITMEDRKTPTSFRSIGGCQLEIRKQLEKLRKIGFVLQSTKL